MDSRDIFISEPKPIKDFPESDYIYALCLCGVPLTYGICIPREEGKLEYHFKCKKCCLKGTVVSG